MNLYTGSSAELGKMVREMRSVAGGFGIPTILVESSLLLTGVVHRRCQQLDTPRNCQISDCQGGDDCFCITVCKRTYKCVNRPQQRFDAA